MAARHKGIAFIGVSEPQLGQLQADCARHIYLRRCAATPIPARSRAAMRYAARARKPSSVPPRGAARQVPEQNFQIVRGIRREPKSLRANVRFDLALDDGQPFRRRTIPSALLHAEYEWHLLGHLHVLPLERSCVRRERSAIPPCRRDRLAAADDDPQFPVVAFGVRDAAVRVVHGAATIIALAGAPLAHGRSKTVKIYPRIRAVDAKRRDDDAREKGQPHRALRPLRLTLQRRARANVNIGGVRHHGQTNRPHHAQL
jgi:hypothetical protein